MLTLHLIRHGETNWNREGRIQGQSESELNDTGREQAGNLRETVAALAPTAVYVSTARRTRQTAELLLERVNVQPVYRDDLREIALGSWENRLWQDVQQAYPEHVADFRESPDRFNFDGAETFHELQQRGVAAIESIASIEQTGSVLVVSHGALLKAALIHYAGQALARLWEEPALHNCAHSVLVADPDGRLRLSTVAGIPASEIPWANRNGV